MNKKERVLSAISGNKVDYVPSCFSLHFPEEKAFGKEGVESHIEFYRKTNTDIFKIMNENLVPHMGIIKSPSDWSKFKTITLKDDFIQNQLDFVKKILERLHSDKELDEKVFTVGTLHGVIASTIHPIEKKYGYRKSRELLCEHLRQEKNDLLDAFKKIKEGMNILAEAYLDAGLDGVYYASLGGEQHYFNDIEFEKYIEPLEKEILSNIKSNGYSILHICKDNLNLNRYVNYTKYSDIINWGVYEGGVSLEKGKEIFGDVTIMGGLKNRSGVLVNGTNAEIEKEVTKLIQEFGKKEFILGADCTLPTDISYDRVAAAVKAARKI